jgi:hypothetical protein
MECGTTVSPPTIFSPPETFEFASFLWWNIYKLFCKVNANMSGVSNTWHSTCLLAAGLLQLRTRTQQREPEWF